jgi:hypothetical protein
MGTNDDGGNGGLHNSLGALLVGRRSDAANTVARGTRHLSLASHTDISSVTGPCRSIPLSHDPVAGVSLTWACSDQLRFSGIYAKLQRLFGIQGLSPIPRPDRRRAALALWQCCWSANRTRRRFDLIERDNLADHASPHGQLHRPDDTGDESPERHMPDPDLPGKREHAEHRRADRQDKKLRHQQPLAVQASPTTPAIVPISSIGRLRATMTRATRTVDLVTS